MIDIKEEWLPVIGFQGRYEVSNYGNVRSLDRTEMWCGYSRKRKGRPMVNCLGKDGYYILCLRDGKKNVNKRVHILVAEVFIGNPQNKPTVNHKDGNKINNHISNLEWATFSENTQHAHDTGLAIAPRTWLGKSGFEIPVAKGVVQKDKHDGTIIGVFGSQKEAALQTGIPVWRISYYLRGMCQYEKNFQWSHAR